MASCAVNRAGVDHCRALIEGKQDVLDSDWGGRQPDAAAQNAYLESHMWEDYSGWHLGLTDGPGEETKALRLRLRGLSTRAPQRPDRLRLPGRRWRHKEVELAAHDLLQLLDKTAG